MVVVYAVNKWRHYLLENKVLIKTDHSLKYLPDQRITTTNQQKWITKLMGLDYEIVYKKGKENLAADCLSRQVPGPELSCSALSTCTPQWIMEIVHSWDSDQGLKDLILHLQLDPQSLPGYCFQNGRLKFQGKLVVGPNDALRAKLLSEFHESPVGGHSGITGTYERISKYFFGLL